MYQIDSEDANFLFMERTGSPIHISLIALYDQSRREQGTTRFQHILQLMESRLSTAPVFRQKIMRVPADLDYPYWVDDDDFDIDYHVRHLALPKPGDWRQFCIQVSRLHSRPLDRSRPLWELYVIEGLEKIPGLPSNSFALYFKIHHCAMDEFTALELMESLHEICANPWQHETPASTIAHLPATAPGMAEMLTQASVNNTRRSLRLLRQSIANYRVVSKILVRGSVRVVRKLVEGETLADVPATRFGGKLGSARVFEGVFYPRRLFDDLAQLVPGANIRHVVLLACGEALRLYLDRHNEAGDTPLTALLQINLRNAGAHALVGNRIAIEQADLFTNVPNLLERLYAIVGGLAAVEDIDELEGRSIKLRSLYEHLPAPLLAFLGRNADRDANPTRQLMHGGNCGIAVMEGPKIPLYLLGAKLHGLTSISPLYSGCGLMFNASCYCEEIALTFTSDRKLMTDPLVMRDCLDEAIAGVRAQLKKSRGVSRV
jgi:WS/DGAT/MGAT family acyltransferase